MVFGSLFSVRSLPITVHGVVPTAFQSTVHGLIVDSQIIVDRFVLKVCQFERRRERSAMLLLVLMFFVSNVTAQVTREPEEKVIADLMERLIENTESTVDYTDLQEQLEYYMKHKLDLNKATRTELEQLPLLNDIDINAILQHRKDFGDFMTVYELQTIEALDERTIYYLSYFVKVGGDFYDDHTPLLQRIANGKHEVITLHDNDFQQRAGYNPSLRDEDKSYYAGSPYRYVLRYRFNYRNKLSFGYTGEKDMGEQFFRGTQSNGFDFNSVHFMIRDMGNWRAIAVGDYQANFGQGLTFGSGMSAGKSAYVTNVRRNYQTLRPYRSLNENEFLRGVAATYRLSNIELTAFGSRKYISTNYANTDTPSTNEDLFSSIQLSGMHRTQTEIAYKDNVLQTIYGAHASYKREAYALGITAVNTNYDIAFVPRDKPYQLYNFSGKRLANIGADYNVQLGNSNLFGEVSHSSNGGWAGLAGLNATLHQNLDMVMMYRNYSKDYQATVNNPFGENGDGRNEEGLYTGLSIKLARKWQLNTYFDWFRSPWLRYLTDAPSHGTDYLAELQYNPGKTSQFYIRYRHEEKSHNQSNNTSAVDYIIQAVKDHYRLNAQYKLSENLSGKSRVEITQYSDPLNGVQRGTLLFQDLMYTTSFKQLSFGGRFAIFSVDDYNARVYATEQDVLYQYSVPLYQNSGIRYYAVTHIRITHRFDLWIKYSKTQYSNLKEIGSGLEKIEGNTLSDLRVQMRVSF
jgi:hypothetical protein